MNQQGYAYNTDETMSKKRGCIAMAGGTALRAMRIVLFHKALNGGHGYFISYCAPSVRGSGKSEKTRRRKDKKFRMEYFRESMSNVPGKARGRPKRDPDGSDTEDESEGGVSSDTDSSGRNNNEHDGESDDSENEEHVEVEKVARKNPLEKKVK
jgi:hypothetical protein